MPSLIGRRPDFARVAAWERERARTEAPDHARNLAIALLAEARALGVWPPAGPRNIDHKIRMARAINPPVRPDANEDPLADGCAG